MGVFKIRVTIAGARREPVEAVVDTGATLTVLPARMLRELGFSPEFRQRFQLADGREQEREVGPAKLAIDGVEATVPVVFGSPGDGVLIGATTLEVMGFAADPVAKKLVRTPAYMLESHRERPPVHPVLHSSGRRIEVALREQPPGHGVEPASLGASPSRKVPISTRRPSRQRQAHTSLTTRVDVAAASPRWMRSRTARAGPPKRGWASVEVVDEDVGVHETTGCHMRAQSARASRAIFLGSSGGRWTPVLQEAPVPQEELPQGGADQLGPVPEGRLPLQGIESPMEAGRAGEAESRAIRASGVSAPAPSGSPRRR